MGKTKDLGPQNLRWSITAIIRIKDQQWLLLKIFRQQMYLQRRGVETENLFMPGMDTIMQGMLHDVMEIHDQYLLRLDQGWANYDPGPFRPAGKFYPARR
ncbi:hypothetical protein CEXT_695521 [Caerostris extrusa]|uniref:Uncharacterized protein n=1 Tax=Caerostris extrusa TaxID=172846 RepID=A0AAV4VTV7_CAEEX|nr:hypothetical protein CEXT_695521 [Caerostris extrusa]